MSDIDLVFPFFPFEAASNILSVFEWKKEYVDANSWKQSSGFAALGMVINFSPQYTSKGSGSMQSGQVRPVT